MRKWQVRVWYCGAVLLEPTVAKSKSQAENNVRWRLRERGIFVDPVNLEAEEMP